MPDTFATMISMIKDVCGARLIGQRIFDTEGIHRLFDPLILEAASLGAGLDWKTSLQELTAGAALGVPEYLVSEEGPDHEKMFTAVVHVGGEAYGGGTGRSKKEAEQEAAAAAWRHLRAELPDDDLDDLDDVVTGA